MTNWEKLLGGYATGTLTGEEREALMQAALHDQALFDALMDEDSLRETLADPATRTALLLALEPPAKTTAWWRNPWPWTGLGAVAAAIALFVMLRTAEPPKAVQMAQNRPAATAPEPEAVVIVTPKQLTASQPETDRKAAATESRMAVSRAQLPAATSPPPPAGRTDATQKMEMAAPAPQVQPQAPRPVTSPRPAAEHSETAGARPDAPAPAQAPAAAMTAKKKETADERLAEPLAVTLSYQAADGAWRPLDLQSAIPASRPLRLHITSGQSGLLSFQPPLAEPRTLMAGIPAEIALPAQPAGTLRLRLTLGQATSQAFGQVSALRQSESRENKTRSMTAADSAVSPSTLIWTREIRLRIE